MWERLKQRHDEQANYLATAQLEIMDDRIRRVTQGDQIDHLMADPHAVSNSLRGAGSTHHQAYNEVRSMAQGGSTNLPREVSVTG